MLVFFSSNSNLDSNFIFEYSNKINYKLLEIELINDLNLFYITENYYDRNTIVFSKNYTIHKNAINIIKINPFEEINFEIIKNLNNFDLIILSDKKQYRKLYKYFNFRKKLYLFKNYEYLEEKISKIINLYIKKDNEFKNININLIRNIKNIYIDLIKQIECEIKINGVYEVYQNKQILSNNSFKYTENINISGDVLFVSFIRKFNLNKFINKFKFIILLSKSGEYINISNTNIIQDKKFGFNFYKRNNEEFRIIIIKSNNIKLSKKYIIYEGNQLILNSLSEINRSVEKFIINDFDYQLSIKAIDFYQDIKDKSLEKYFNRILLKKADIYIRHIIPKDFLSPDEGKYILMFPWELRSLPIEYAEHINKYVDEVWAISNYIKELYLAGGVIKEKIKVIPCGIDNIFFEKKNNYIPYYKKDNIFKFLFIGGLIYRKGIDLLLQAYQKAFSSKDKVLLIIKALGINSYYKEENIIKYIEEFKKDNRNPKIKFIKKNLNTEEVFILYNSVDTYVHPFRGEGFGLPIIEAMACNLPVITNNYGPVNDFDFTDNKYSIEYKIKNIKEDNYIITICESDINSLSELMLKAFNNREKINYNIKKFRWENIYNEMKERINILYKRKTFRDNIKDNIDLLNNNIPYYIFDNINFDEKLNIIISLINKEIDCFELINNMIKENINNKDNLNKIRNILK